MSLASGVKGWVQLLRPHQYTKNVLLFVPMVFGRRWDAWPETLLGFVAWSLMASAIYAFNDARDAAADRLHPTKRLRPVAAGLVSPQIAYWTALLLGLLSLSGAFALNGPFAQLLLLYGANALLYTLYFKKLPLIDVFSIAAGFLLRVYGGAQVGQIPVSGYLFMVVFFLSLFLALGKRRHELLLLPPEATQASRKSLKGYSVYYLDQLMNISATLTLTVYILYLMHTHFTWLWGTLPLVVLGLFRYYHLTHNQGAGEPSRDLFADKMLLLIGAVYGGLALLETLEVPFPPYP
ncbi:MAG: decaprenyl-phosphate phosphoribosyltransferase [Bacteroidia bacterium]|nr:MAG: decaprenyl-phosphate phosphoribosyltransferase [Bacteroidia bacterium]